MIIEAIINLVAVILGGVFALLPEFSLSQHFPEPNGIAGYYIAIADIFVPLLPMLVIVGVILNVALPGYLIYVLANWFYRHIPSFAGFGPSGG